MQGKVSTTLLTRLLSLPLNPVIGSNDNPRFLCPAKSRRLATADEYIQRAGDADGKVDLVKVQFAQLSLFSASQYKLHLVAFSANGEAIPKLFEDV